MYGDGYREDESRYYPSCRSCGESVWHKCLMFGICASCALKLPEFVLEISFGRSRSKDYDSVVRQARGFVVYLEDGGRHVLRFDNAFDFAMLAAETDSLTLRVSDWKSFRATLNGEPITPYHVICLSAEVKRKVGNELTQAFRGD